MKNTNLWAVACLVLSRQRLASPRMGDTAIIMEADDRRVTRVT